MKKFLKIISLCFLPSLLLGQEGSPDLNNLYRSLSIATNDTDRMKVYSNLGSYYSMEDRDSSNFNLEKALTIAVRFKLKFDEASILNRMGAIQMQQEKFSKSLEFYLKALNIAKDPATEKTILHLSPGQNPMTARMLLISKCYDLIGMLNAYSGNWIDNINNQLKNYREAEKYANASGDSGQIATVIFHMGISYLNAGQLDSALIFIKKAQTTFADLKDPQLGRTMIYQGETYERMGNFDLAISTMLQAMTILNETNDYVHRGLGYNALSRVYANLKKNDSALYYAKESLKIFEKRKDFAWKRDSYNLLAYNFDQLGNTDSATIYLKLSKTLSDSLNVEVRKNLLAFQDVVVGEQVKLEKLEKEKIETREKLRIYLLMSGIIVFMVIVFLLYRNNQHRKKTNETLRQRNEKIENTLHQLRSTQTQLIQSEKMASLGELTAGIAHEIQNPLNFVNNFSELNNELFEEMQEEIKKGNINEVKSIVADIRSNLEKINLHGKRADAIVKGMMQHSRTTSAEKQPTNINALAEEYLRLAYHGLRGKDKSFNAKLITDFDPSIEKVYIIPQDIGRVLLNLYNNAFYAVNEKSKEAVKGYEPEVSVSTRQGTKPQNSLIHQSNNSLIISVKDNGNGIPEQVLEKVFQPFFTTKPTGQGTGLGLSLSYDIIKAHQGTINIKNTPGEGAEFIIFLPINA